MDDGFGEGRKGKKGKEGKERKGKERKGKGEGEVDWPISMMPFGG